MRRGEGLRRGVGLRGRGVHVALRVGVRLWHQVGLRGSWGEGIDGGKALRVQVRRRLWEGLELRCGVQQRWWRWRWEAVGVVIATVGSRASEHIVPLPQLPQTDPLLLQLRLQLQHFHLQVNSVQSHPEPKLCSHYYCQTLNTTRSHTLWIPSERKNIFPKHLCNFMTRGDENRNPLT